MSDTQPSQRAIKPDGPDYRDTKQIPAVQVSGNTLEAVLAEVKAMRAEQQDTRTELKADIQLVANDLGIVKERVRLVERRQDDADERAKNNSMRAKSLTDDDAKQDAAIATLMADVAAVKEAQTTAAAERAQTAGYVKEIRDTVVKSATGLAAFFKDPRVVFFGKTVFALVSAAAVAKGLVAK